MTDRGHNSSDDKLRLLVERIERVEADKKDLVDDIKDIYTEAKALGYDTRIIREIVKYRKMKPDDLRERNTVLQLYAASLGVDLL